MAHFSLTDVPAVDSVALLPEKCPHCGAPCRKEVLMRGGDNGWGDDASRTVFRYALAHRQDGELLALADRLHDEWATVPLRDPYAVSVFLDEAMALIRTLAASPRGVEASAIAWWLSKRPVGWTAEQHRAQARVNCTTDAEVALAQAVAALSQPSELSKSQVNRIALERGESPGLADSGEVGNGC